MYYTFIANPFTLVYEFKDLSFCVHIPSLTVTEQAMQWGASSDSGRKNGKTADQSQSPQCAGGRSASVAS